MKIVFLDCDGVLNNANYIKKCYKKSINKKNTIYSGKNVPFDPKCLKNLAKIVKKTNAKIVLSSTWRIYKSHIYVLEARLAEYGLRIYDKTDDINMIKGAEITEWLKQHRDIENYVVIDDEEYNLSNFIDNKHLVIVDSKYGLTFGDRIRAINKLKGVE